MSRKSPQVGRAGDWHRRALCATHPVDLWNTDPHNKPAIAQARAICGTCPVRDDCLADAMLHHDLPGVRACTMRDERRQLRNQMRTPRDARWHGTPGGYTNHGCRCFACKLAHARYKRRPGAAHRHAQTQARYRNRTLAQRHPHQKK